MSVIRSPIVCVLGHVDHGKTTVLDVVRGSTVATKEAGRITQMIGASYVPKKVIFDFSKSKQKLIIPGLLFIDTPGHEAFANLRERGGSIADMAILVVDIMQGVQPQTIESIKILKDAKTPFVIAANKIDLIRGWKSYSGLSFLESLEKQPQHVKELLDERLYVLMGQISKYGFDSERFDRIDDFTRQIGIVPISAKTKEGIGELLLLVAGLSQRYLGKKLNLTEGCGKGSVIEVKEVKGLGTTLDVILYDGILKKGDEILVLSKEGIKKTKVRGLLQPNVKGSKEVYLNVDNVAAAAGVKIIAPDLEGTIPGSPMIAVSDYEKDKKEIRKQVCNIMFETGEDGIVLKADSLGSVEAILSLLKKENIKVREAGVGSLSKKDVMSASSVKDRYLRVVIGFNVAIKDDAREEAEKTGTEIIWSDIIYRLPERYVEWKALELEREKKELIAEFPWPFKLKILKGFFFRANKPAVFGVEVLEGILKKGAGLMNEKGERIGEVKSIQLEGKSINSAEKGEKVAVSSDEIVLNKTLFEKEILYSFMTRTHLKEWSKRTVLSKEEEEITKEIKKIVLNSI
ncbi:translation initiation factor IF-2 [Candidatus Micrarchaeota archaeon]|nr:translation initiation factor IF-2 [Candidatus Micrarchaeota archaeon]